MSNANKLKNQKSDGFNGLEDNNRIRIEQIIEKDNGFNSYSDVVNGVLSKILNFLDSEQISEILKKDQDEKYFHANQLNVLEKILDTGLDFWSDPKKGTLKIYDDFENIPNKIIDEWEIAAPEFIERAREYNFSKNSIKLAENFNELYLKNSCNIENTLEKINFKQYHINELKKFISNSENIVTYEKDYLELINTSINRLLVVKYFIHLILYYLIIESKNTGKVIVGIEIDSFKKFSLISMKEFISKLILLDILNNKVKVSRTDRSATSLPFSSEVYSEIKNFRINEIDKNPQKKIEEEISKILDNNQKKYENAFNRIFDVLFGVLTTEKPLNFKNSSFLFNIGLIKYVNQHELDKNETVLKPYLTLSSKGLELIKIIDPNENQLFSKKEAKFIFNQIIEYSPIEKIVNKEIMNFYDNLDERFEKPKTQKSYKGFIDVFDEEKQEFTKVKFSEHLKKIEQQRNEQLDNNIKNKILKLLEHPKLSNNENQIEIELKERKEKLKILEGLKRKNLDSQNITDGNILDQIEDTKIEINRIEDNLRKSFEIKIEKILGKDGKNIRAVRLATLGRLQNLGIVTWSSEDNFNDYSWNKDFDDLKGDYDIESIVGDIISHN